MSTRRRTGPPATSARSSAPAYWWTRIRAVGRREVLLPRAEEAHHVRRAARAGEPRLALAGPLVRRGAVRAPLERVDVEERRPRLGHARQDAVVDGPLDEVRAGRVAGRQQQPPGEHHARDRRAGLRVGQVRRQLVRVAERLVVVAAAETAGQVRPRLDHVVPAGQDRRSSRGRRARRRGRHAAVEVHLAHGVAGDLGGVADREVVLPVGRSEPPRPQEAVAAQVDHPSASSRWRRSPVVRYSSTRAISTSGCPSIPSRPSGPSSASTDGHGAERDLEQAVVADRAVPRDRGLHEVAEAVQLVAPRQVAVRRPAADDLDVGVQVAVRALRRRDEPDDLVGRRGEVGSGPRPSSQPTASSHL